jgi:hypothetical protein
VSRTGLYGYTNIQALPRASSALGRGPLQLMDLSSQGPVIELGKVFS